MLYVTTSKVDLAFEAFEATAGFWAGEGRGGNPVDALSIALLEAGLLVCSMC